jgi:hypothetical protein
MQCWHSAQTRSPPGIRSGLWYSRAELPPRSRTVEVPDSDLIPAAESLAIIVAQAVRNIWVTIFVPIVDVWRTVIAKVLSRAFDAVMETVSLGVALKLMWGSVPSALISGGRRSLGRARLCIRCGGKEQTGGKSESCESCNDLHKLVPTFGAKTFACNKSTKSAPMLPATFCDRHPVVHSVQRTIHDYVDECGGMR